MITVDVNKFHLCLCKHCQARQAPWKFQSTQKANTSTKSKHASYTCILPETACNTSILEALNLTSSRDS